MTEITNKQFILDNYEGIKVADYLRKNLPNAETFRLVSAYFSIYGFQLLQKELEQLNDVRFLFGNPSFVGDVDPGQKDEKTFNLSEEGLSLNHILHQRNIARNCENWVEKDKVQIKSINKPNFLHGKMYLSYNPNHNSAIVGSSNFTRRGLGGTDHPNVEINLATINSDIYTDLETWFDKLWNNQEWTKDVKEEVIKALRRIGKDYSPELIYFKTLFELFYNEIDRRKFEDDYLHDTRFLDTKIWKALYSFQQEGVKSVIERLKNLNGCILADSVGLGKTYTALAVIKFFELENKRVLVLSPKRLHENWAIYPVYNNQSNNPFLDDRLNYTLLSHTDLTRSSGFVGGIDLSNFNWGNYDLVVIDESHNFRTGTKPLVDETGNIIKNTRYSKLLEDVIKTGPNTKVLMLSATPVNISLNDLKNQIYIATEGRDEVFRSKLGVSNIGNLISQAQKKFKEWENGLTEGEKRNKAELLELLGADFLQLLGGISIARSKKHIKKYYKDELDKIGQFPKVNRPVNFSPNTDFKNAFSFEELASSINCFSLSIYQPSKYLLDDKEKNRLEEEKKRLQFNQMDREVALLGMIRTNFLKRLESSAFSLKKTLNRTIDKIDDLLNKIENFEEKKISIDIKENLSPDDDEEDEEFYVNKDIRHPYHLNQLDLDNWRNDIQKDRNALETALELVKIVTPSRDGKLIKLKEIIKEKVNNPPLNQDDKPNRKILVFTTFKDTAEYLYDNLEDLSKELKINLAFVSGEYTKTQVGENNFNSILTNFSPQAKARNDARELNIDLLVATDCISEGQNLQDCDMVVNYDIHWNPVRIIQRFGRIDRIGSRSRSIQMINFWPVKDMDNYLKLAPRVGARMTLVGATASGEDLLNPSENDPENSFRDEQLKKLRNEVIDLDELSENLVISDFTLDDFFAELINFLEKNKKELEEIPLGAFSLAESIDQNSQGIIFVLKKKDSKQDIDEKTSSQIHPYYLTHIDPQGKINIACTNAKKVLDLFQKNTFGQKNAHQSLCDDFDEFTHYGKDMTLYNQLLHRVIEHITNKNIKAFKDNLITGMEPNFKLPETVKQNPLNNFELITWLIIK